MFDRSKAAEFWVVAWCKNWDMKRYLRVVTETEAESDFVTPEEIAAAHAAFPWMPAQLGAYIKHTLVRAQTADNFPKLSEWLWSRKDDLSRLKCAAQVERLKNSDVRKPVDHPPRVNQDYSQVQFMRTRIGEQRHSHSRSAWNVCKG